MTRVAIKGLTARPLRTLLTTLSIVLGVALVSAAFTITDTQSNAADALSSAAYDGTDAVVSAQTPLKVDGMSWATRPAIDAKTLDEVRAIPGVEFAAGDITDEAKIIGTDGKPLGQGPYFGIGVDTKQPKAFSLTPFKLRDGAWPTGPGQVAIDAASAEKEDYAVGDQIKVTTRGEVQTFEVTGIAMFGTVKSLGTATAAVFELGAAQQLFDKAGQYDSILVAGDRKAVEAKLGQSFNVQSAVDHDRFTFAGLEEFVGILQAVLFGFGLVAVFVGAFTILNTLSITVAQRTREFGLLRMIGASKRQIRRTVLTEALIVGFVASVIGLAAGYGLAILLNSAFAALGLELPQAETVFATRTIVVSLLVGTLATLLAGFWPARKATKIAPVAALHAASAEPSKIGFFARGVRAAASVLGRPAQRIGGSAGMLARRNAMRNPGRTGSTAIALTIGVALITMVTVVAEGLKGSVRDQLTDQVTATHVVTGQDGWSPVDPKIETALASTTGVESVTSLKQDAGIVFGEEEGVNAVDPKSVVGMFDFAWKDGAGQAQVLGDLGTNGAVVDDGWATEHKLGVGDTFSVKTSRGKDLDLTVRGIETSPVIDALGLGPVTIGRQAFDDAFAAEKLRLTFVRGNDVTALEKTLAAYPDAKIAATGEYVDEQVAAVNPLLAIFGVLLALCVIVSLIGIVNALVLATFERTREIGTLRAMGMSRRQLKRMIRHESVITSLLGAATGMVIGIGLALIVTTIFKDEGLQFVIPAFALIAFTIVACVAGVLAAIFPARRAARLNPLAALAYE
jgi:putative ABC transport system permease protein